MTKNTLSAEPPYLDIASDSFAMQSEEVRDAREKSWYAKTNYGYAILRYDEVAKFLRDTRLSQGSAKWPEHHDVHSGIFYDWWSKNLLVLEGDEHRRIRKLVNPAFSPMQARRLEPAFAEIAEELIGTLKEKLENEGQIEFVSDFAEPFATRALCAMLDISHEHWPFIAKHANTIGYALSVTIKQDIDRIDAAVQKLYDFVDELIQERKDNLESTDVVSTLVRANLDGEEALSDAELRNVLVLMLFGGMDTTRNQLGLAMQTFARQNDQWEILASDTKKYGRAAVEEVLRVNPTTRWVTREALEDINFEGLEIPQGTTVHLFTMSSGTDPQAFPNPEIDLEVKPEKAHFTFGGGMHQCLGQAIARADMGVAISMLAEHFTELECLDGDEWLPDSGNHGPIKLPMRMKIR